MALELRPNCEFCDKDLPPASTEARICTFECTFCADCVEDELQNVCPNCGGGFEPRPIRPATAWRPGPLAGRAPGIARARAPFLLARGHRRALGSPQGHPAGGALVDAQVLLERTDQLSALAVALDAVTAARAGAVIFVGGEAGAGKTVLLRAFCDQRRDSARILWGACDGLLTPGPLGPLFDVSEVTGGELEELVSREARPHEVTGALIRELAGTRPTVLVLEDLHWADEATLDVLRLLARKVEGVPTLVLASYRDDELDRAHPLTLVLGELATTRAVTRLAIPPLSQQAVGELAAPHEIDAGELHRQTNGNAFYVTEVLAAGTGEIPHTVRDAVLARLARLSAPARRLLEAIAIATPQAEVWLLEALAAAELRSSGGVPGVGRRGVAHGRRRLPPRARPPRRRGGAGAPPPGRAAPRGDGGARGPAG